VGDTCRPSASTARSLLRRAPGNVAGATWVHRGSDGSFCTFVTKEMAQAPHRPPALTNHDIPRSYPHHDVGPGLRSRPTARAHRPRAPSAPGRATRQRTEHSPRTSAPHLSRKPMRYVHCQCAPTMVFPEGIHPPHGVRARRGGVRRGHVVAGHPSPRGPLPELVLYLRVAHSWVDRSRRLVAPHSRRPSKVPGPQGRSGGLVSHGERGCVGNGWG